MSREAMKLALKTLEQIAGAMPFPVGKNAITALRAALDAPEWIGLPDMEVYDLADKHLYGGKDYGILSFYKAIEAKLKEKNT